jgi:hypothetical protein
MFFCVPVPVQAARANLFRGDLLEAKYFGLVSVAFNVLLVRSNDTPHSRAIPVSFWCAMLLRSAASSQSA